MSKKKINFMCTAFRDGFNHILMAHEDYRIIMILSFPSQKKRFSELIDFTCRENMWKKGTQHFMKSLEFMRVIYINSTGNIQMNQPGC